MRCTNNSWVILRGFGYPSVHFGFEASAFVEDRNPLSHYKRFDQYIETIPFCVLCTGNFQGGDSSATKARSAELLRRRQLLARIQDKPGWCGTDQLIVGCTEFQVEVGNGQIQNAEEQAFKGKDEVWIAWRSAQLTITGRKQRFRFEQGCHLTICGVEDREGMRSVIPTTPLKGTDGGQGRVSPSVGDHPKTGLGVVSQWSVLQRSDDFLDGIQEVLFRPVA